MRRRRNVLVDSDEEEELAQRRRAEAEAKAKAKAATNGMTKGTSNGGGSKSSAPKADASDQPPQKKMRTLVSSE